MLLLGILSINFSTVLVGKTKGKRKKEKKKVKHSRVAINKCKKLKVNWFLSIFSAPRIVLALSLRLILSSKTTSIPPFIPLGLNLKHQALKLAYDVFEIAKRKEKRQTSAAKS